MVRVALDAVSARPPSLGLWRRATGPARPRTSPTLGELAGGRVRRSRLGDQAASGEPAPRPGQACKRPS